MLILVAQLREAEHQLLQENKAKTILIQAHELTKLFFDAGQSVALYGILHKEDFLRSYDEKMPQIPQQIERIKTSLHDLDPNDHSFDNVERAAYKGLSILRANRARSDLGDTNFFRRDMRPVLQEYVKLITTFVEQKGQFANEIAPEASARSRHNVIVLIWIMVVANLLAGVFLVLAFRTLTTKRLAVLMDNTLRMGRHEKLNPALVGDDELAHLDSVFHEMVNALEEASRRKQELVSMVSHDLRTPLMSMQVSLELLSAGAMGDLPEQARKELSVAEYSTTRLIHLINDLLDIDKMESGKFELHKRHADVGFVFERCARSVRAFADRYKVSLTYDDTEEVDIYADIDRVSQVITNLVSNAIKFSPPGSEVRMEAEITEGGTVVRIVDHGRGIPPGFENRIFERFQQVDSKDEREKKGSGLGLAICKMMVEAHEGQIGVQSKQGEGSTFWFRIPPESAAERAENASNGGDRVDTTFGAKANEQTSG